ncbi:MAG: dehydrogenase [Polyangiaceae bacterium]|nr:dehydrogenase [Polyangiaceae bacterium]
MKLPSKSVEDLDPAFGRMAVEVGQQAWAIPELTMREKALILLASDICQQHLDLPLSLHLQVGLANGLTFEDVREAVRHLALYAGFPAALRALARVAEVEAERGSAPSSAPADQPAFELPKDICDQLTAFDPWFADFVTRQVGRAFRRGGLSAKERTLLAIAADVCHQTLGRSMAANVGIALGAGVSAVQIRAALHLLTEVVGVGRAWAALTALEEHTT